MQTEQLTVKQRDILKQLHEQFSTTTKFPQGWIALDPSQVRQLEYFLGEVKDSGSLVGKILNIGVLRVQGKEFQLTREQIQRLKTEAFFHHERGEPSSEASATPEEVELVLDRYLTKQLNYYIGMMLSEV